MQPVILIGISAGGLTVLGAGLYWLLVERKKEQKPKEIVNYQPGTTKPVAVKADINLEKPLFQIEKGKDVPQLPDFPDQKQINIKYPLIPPYCFAHVYWDANESELVYKVEEPELTKEEQRVLKILEDGIKELINLSFINVKDPDIVLLYLEKNIRVLLTELSINLSKESFLKVVYYIYRDFVGLNELEPMLNDYYIEDIECNGLNSPVYIVHRKLRNLRSNLIFTDLHKLASFVEKLAQKCGKYVSYAEPLLDGALPDGSRCNATYSTDVSSKGPTFCITGGYIQLNNGVIKEIDKLFEEIKNNFGCKLEEGNEIVEVINMGCIGVEEKDLTQRNSRIKTIIKLTPPKKLVEIKLADGAEITTTTNHLFHIVADELKLVEAEKLEKGMIVPLPRKVDVEGCSQKINVYNLLKEFSYAHKICLISNERIKNIVNSEILLYNTRKDIAAEYNVGNSYFYEIMSRGNSISFEVLDKLCDKQEINFEKLNDLKVVVYGGGTKGNNKEISLPSEVDADLAYLAGAIISDGHLSENNIDISTYELGFKDAVSEKLVTKFGKSEEFYNGNRVYLCNKFVPYYFNRVFEIPYGKKSRTVKVPEVISKSDNNVVASFVRGLFDGDGTCKSGLSYKTYSKELVYGLSYLLARLGIYCYIKKNLDEYKLNIPSIYEKVYAEKIGFSNNEKAQYLSKLLTKKDLTKSYIRHGRMPAKPVIELLKELKISKNQVIKELKVSYNRLVYYDTISKPFATQIVTLFENKGIRHPKIEYIRWLINSEQEFVKIESINVFDNTENKPVYDIELEPCKFFIAGNRPMNIFDTIRKFTKEPWSPIQLMQKGTISAEMLAYMWMIIEYERSFMVVGGTGSGKTSLLNVVAFFIPPQDRVVTIEDTRELQLEHENWLPSVARAGVGLTNLVGQKYGEVSLFDLLRESFRQRPDYIIVGEIRGKEAFVLMQGISSGHPSYGTMHAESVETMVRRLQTEPINLSGSLIQGLTAVCVMMQTKVKGQLVRRLSKIDEIVEVKEQLGGVKTNPVFKWDPKTDKFMFNPNTKAFYDIGIQFGLSKEQLMTEFKRRVALINTLYTKRIVGFKEVQKIIHQYYKDPKTVLTNLGIK